MKDMVRSYLKSMPHFEMLPEEELGYLAGQAIARHLPKGHLLAEQGKTTIQHIYVIRSGQISIYDEKSGKRELGGFIKTGEVFGGITLLMNAGISLRTVLVDEETDAFLIPQEKFLDLCARNKDFYGFFVNNFSKHITDPALDTIIASGQAKIFLSGVAPFSFLPEEAIEDAASRLSSVFHPKGSILFSQGRSRVGYLYILQKGSAERYYAHNGQKSMRDILSEGDVYGGISMLLNDGLSVRTLEVTEDAYFYLLPRDKFLNICEAHSVFSEFFTDTFGKRMLDKSYAAILARTAAPPEEGLQLLNRPVRQICNPATVFGTPDMSIRQVAMRMQQENSTYLMVPSADPQSAGIITESDLTRKVIAKGYDISRPAVEVMSSPLRTIDEQAMVSDALLTMMKHNVKHLAVTGAQDQIIGVLSNRELVSAQGQSPLFLLREISRAESLEDIIQQHNRLPGIVKGLISSGATARNINRMITTVSDTILKKIMTFVMKEMGPAPVSFAFMILGSEGRGEQTLKTDQDNAIVFDDVSEAELTEVTSFFLEVGRRACKLLDQAGYDYCEGEVMAQNPNWCQPLSTWMNYFLQWIHAAEAEDLLQASIFFDFRCGYGDEQLIESLKDHLRGSIARWSGFLRYMTENALYFKPPLGFFRNFVVESKGEHRDALDIKSAMTPIVDFARVYALKNGITATNTMDRLHQLRVMKILTQEEYDEMEKAYSFLMQLRLTRHVTAAMDQKKSPDNFINPKRLTRIEQTMLKEIFKRIEKFQSKMNFEFIGIA
ncbi:MAG: putative nucleotidyltransferase substrate binding domain-containing protein [Desulfobacteraceae bacterium]|jgi:CBS domain-containing protein